jgi:hypothetical protein
MTMPEKETLARAPLNGKLQAHLGKQLRRLFNETAAEPIPDRFADLLDRLDRGLPPAQPGSRHASVREAL